MMELAMYQEAVRLHFLREKDGVNSDSQRTMAPLEEDKLHVESDDEEEVEQDPATFGKMNDEIGNYVAGGDSVKGSKNAQIPEVKEGSAMEIEEQVC